MALPRLPPRPRCCLDHTLRGPEHNAEIRGHTVGPDPSRRLGLGQQEMQELVKLDKKRIGYRAFPETTQAAAMRILQLHGLTEEYLQSGAPLDANRPPSGLEHPLEEIVDQLLDKRLFVREAAIEGPHPHAGGVGDFFHRRFEPPGREDLRGGVEDPAPIELGVFA
jgi:hypothetical protein